MTDKDAKKRNARARKFREEQRVMRGMLKVVTVTSRRKPDTPLWLYYYERFGP